MKKTLARGVAASAIAAVVAGSAITGALAQDYQGSVVTVGGGTTGVAGGDVQVVAPGVVISGGDVVNSTGIGVDSAGGSSIGASTGGDESAAVVE